MLTTHYKQFDCISKATYLRGCLMKYEIVNLHERVECCLAYIDDINKDLKDLIYNNFLEIVNGKKVAERITDDEIKESFADATKFIYMKEGINFRLGIVGELLFHSLMRTKELSSKYLSTSPTIGYSDCYQAFFKGFDGCYYSDESIWLVEIKSQHKVSNLDSDNKSKLKIASEQIKAEANDQKIDRWQKSKKYVCMQLSQIEADEKNIFKLLSKPSRLMYNQMLGTLLICKNCNFDKDFIKSYVQELFHNGIPEQRLLIMCIRSFDYEKIIEFIEKEIGVFHE